ETEFDVVRILMSQAKELLLTLSDDGVVCDESIFQASRNIAKRLMAFAKEDNIPVASAIVCDYKGFFKEPELLHIAENIYSRNSDITPIAVSDENCPIKIYSSFNIYEEADFVARKIRELIMTKGYRYKDIAVVTRDISPYFGVLDSALAKYGISYFMDTPMFIHSKPLLKLITACFECITTSFQKDAVLRLLKTGLTSADDTDISLFENYVFTWGISGTKFYSEFKANPRGFADEFTSDDLYELSKVESLRKFIIEPLLAFREKVKSATGETICRELYSLFITLGADKKVISLCNKYEEQGFLQLSEEQVRLWQMFTDTLDRTVSVIGSRKMPPKRFCELLNLQFSSQDMSFIPKGADQVTVGDIERLRLADKKVVFVIGAEEGRFPKAPVSGGLFTPSERALLTESGVLSDNSVHLETLNEEYLCYYALTSASDYLFVSYSNSTLKGTPIYPSEIISRLKGIFEGLCVVESQDVPILDRLWSSDSAFSIYASRVGSTDSLTKSLEEYYINNEKYKSSAETLRRAVYKQDFQISDTKNAESLFGNNMRLSASQVEKYHLCRFQYFLNYGLRVRERRPAKVDALEFGSFVHYILEHFIGKYTKAQMAALSGDDIRQDIDFLVGEYAEKHFGGLEDKSQRFIYLYGRVTVYVQKVVEHLVRELSQSSFNPEEFELDIGNDIPAYTLSLPTGQTVTITGKVDRADLMRKEGRTYIRIVDYKTNAKTFDLSDVLYGLNLQMLIYLSVLQKKGKDRFKGEVIPSGVLYMPSMIPIVSAAFGDDEAKINKEIEKSLKMNGLILRDMNVIEGMEREVEGIYIPVSIKKGELKGADNLATLEEFGAIFSRIDELIGEMATELLGGNIAAIPTKGGVDACEYCPYKAVCNHKDTDKSRTVFKLERSKILKELGIEEVKE
ncbi:MAG: exodeoxyribonuclease V subunit gamma, partial [Ruminococcus sp.]|nr:exodeoxyribonuclease V subunit gamma [Ruminococcus sp.]